MKSQVGTNQRAFRSVCESRTGDLSYFFSLWPFDWKQMNGLPFSYVSSFLDTSQVATKFRSNQHPIITVTWIRLYENTTNSKLFSTQTSEIDTMTVRHTSGWERRKRGLVHQHTTVTLTGGGFLSLFFPLKQQHSLACVCGTTLVGIRESCSTNSTMWVYINNPFVFFFLQRKRFSW